MSLSMPTGTLLIPRDVGAAWGRPHAEELARNLEIRLKQPVALCFPDDAATPLPAAIQSLVETGTRRLVILPLGLLPLPDRGVIPQAIARARLLWPDLACHAAAPLTWLEWSGWLRLTALDQLCELRIPPQEAAVLLVGAGTTSPLTNANLARLAHLLHEGCSLGGVSYAFAGISQSATVRPEIPDAVQALAAQGRRHVVVIPWLISAEDAVQRLEDEVALAARAHGLAATLAMPTLSHSALINILVANHYAALSDDRLRSLTDSKNQESEPPTGTTREMEFELQELERRINSILPREYQGRYEEVRSQSMGTVGLKFDSTGKVAWDEIWTSFCDLALAGGPPHRGTLLEAVTAAEALGEPDQYQAVVAEIERAVRMTTGLPTVASQTAGWVGVRCDSEEMAVWLMRAIIVENVMVRREGEILYVPAGPRFTLKREIKNVVTSIAKTVHYWQAHLLTRSQSSENGL